VLWWDLWVKRARLELAGAETLDYVPPWIGKRLRWLGDERAARVSLSGTSAAVFADLDPARTGHDLLPYVAEVPQVVNERTTNWTAGPCPNPLWAERVHPDLPPEEALERLWEEVVHVCRLDADDPVAAWRERMEAVTAAADRLTERRFDALAFSGPGTDLTIGLLGGSTWHAARFETVDGIEHMPNLPTEEVFTTPDPARADGHVTASKPLVLIDGTVVRNLRVSFEGGRVARIDAESAQDTMRTIVGQDEGAARLGEVALVDDEGRIGKLDTVFYDTLIDENAASHIALGQGFPFLLSDGDHERANESQIHIDFMIGSPEMTVTGITREGDRVPVLVRGKWAI
nr:aminopeptidase [Actinomycetota bacterium]